MKTFSTKYTQISPIKSPSPDVGNRNYIRDTIAPFQEIQRYKTSRSRQPSPRISNSLTFSTSPTEVEKLKSEISILRQQLRIMRNNQMQYRNLKQRNDLLSQQVTYLNEQIEKIKKRYLQMSNNGQSKGFNDDKNIIRQFNDRMSKLSQENYRLIAQLQDQVNKTKIINKQNEILKSQLLSYKNKQYVSSYPIQNQYLFVQFRIHSEQIQKQFENRILLKFNQLEFKMDKVQSNQHFLLDKIQKIKMQSTITHTRIPKQDSIEGISQYKRPEIIKNQRYNQIESRIRILPQQGQQKLKSQNIRLSDKIIMLTRQIDHLKNNCNDKQQEIRRLEENLKNLNIEKKDKQFERVNIGKQSQLAFQKQKIKDLELDLKTKIDKINKFQEDCQIKQKQCLTIQKKLDQANSWIYSYQKMIQQQRLKTQNLEQQKKMLLNQINRLSDQQKTHIELKEQLSQLPNLMHNMEILESEMEKKNNLILNAFKQYLILINQIKSTLCSQKIEKVISYSSQFQEGVINLENIKIESANVIGQLKKKLLIKQQRILQLEKQNYMLKAEIQQLQSQKSKLRELIQEYSAPQIKQINSINFQAKKKVNLGVTLRECIEEAMNGINKLQREVNARLLQIREQKRQ